METILRGASALPPIPKAEGASARGGGGGGGGGGGVVVVVGGGGGRPIWTISQWYVRTRTNTHARTRTPELADIWPQRIRNKKKLKTPELADRGPQRIKLGGDRFALSHCLPLVSNVLSSSIV